jgi:hypothetical protein
MIGIGIGIPLTRGGVSAPTLGTTMATTHYNRVIADGGVVPAGISGLSSVLDSVIAAYGVTTTADFNIQVPVFLDPHYTGYKLGAGSGTTLGQAAQKIYSISTRADVTQTTAASQPLLLAHSGVNYWWNGGVAGNYVSTPNAAANQITGDIEMIAYVDYKNNSGYQFLTSKSNSSGIAYTLDFYIDSSDFLNFQFSLPLYQNATSTIKISNPFVGYIKINRIASTGVVKFYTSLNGITYTQLGSNVSTVLGNLAINNDNLDVGRYFNGTNLFQGKIYRVTLSNTIGGAPVVDFNPATYNAATSQTAWTSSTGEVWTINRSTGATYCGILVDQTKMQTIAGLSQLVSGTANTFVTGNNVTYTLYVGSQQFGSPLQQCAVTLRGLGSASIEFDKSTTFSFYAQDNAGTVRRFNGNNTNSYDLSITSIIANTTTTGYLNNVVQLNSSTVQSSTTINKVLLSGGNSLNSFTGIVSSVILAATTDATTPRTAMYNVLKTMNKL